MKVDAQAAAAAETETRADEKYLRNVRTKEPGTANTTPLCVCGVDCGDMLDAERVFEQAMTLRKKSITHELMLDIGLHNLPQKLGGERTTLPIPNIAGIPSELIIPG